MSRLLILALCSFIVTGASAQMEIPTGGTIRKTNAPPGGPGSSYQRALPITARDQTSGVRTEYAILAKTYPGSKPTNHSREYYTGRRYDVITFTTAGGEKRWMYFRYTVSNQ